MVTPGAEAKIAGAVRSSPADGLPTVAELHGLLGPRDLEIRLIRTMDGGAVWDCVVRSVRRVIWRSARRDLGELLAALVEWLRQERTS